MVQVVVMVVVLRPTLVAALTSNESRHVVCDTCDSNLSALSAKGPCSVKTPYLDAIAQDSRQGSAGSRTALE